MKPPAGYRPPPESDLIDEIMLAAGKALYLANSFESKCKAVLTYAYAEEELEDDPVRFLQEELENPDLMKEHLSAKLRGKMLNQFVHALKATPPGMSEQQYRILDKAREARNHIAHETAGVVGGLQGRDVVRILAALRWLHSQVTDVANGDYIVSGWLHQIEDRDAPFWSSAHNLAWAEYWVFGHVPQEWLDADWEPNHQPPRTIREAVSYKPWYSKLPSD